MSKPLEMLFGPLLRGQPGTRTSEETNAWAGRTSLGSGSSSVTVSTTLVKSDSLIFLTEAPGSVTTVAGSHGHVVVNSIVHGISFALARSTATATPWSATVGWMIWRTTPDAH